MNAAYFAGNNQEEKSFLKYAPLLIFVLIIMGCRDSAPPPSQVVSSLQALQQLATVSYEVSKVVKANDNLDWYKIGDRKILITCHATIKAGIDLESIKPEQVGVSGKNIRLQLPPPRILSVNLPPGKIKVAYRDVSFFRSEFTGAEIDQLMAQAEKQMWESGTSLGIMEQAKVNTQLAISDLLLQLGFQEVNITFDAPSSPSNLLP